MTERASGRLLLMTSRERLVGDTRPFDIAWFIPALVRYRGPLLDYGNVMILEPGDGYLLILAGFDQVYGQAGEVVSKGDALGLMGGREGDASDILAPDGGGAGASGSETLYVELRKDGQPVDPLSWFVPEGE